MSYVAPLTVNIITQYYCIELLLNMLSLGIITQYFILLWGRDEKTCWVIQILLV